MATALHLAATLRHLGERDLAQLRRVEVVGFARDEIDVLSPCAPATDGFYRAEVEPDPERHHALALRLWFGDGRTRLCAAAPLCACRCQGVAVVVYDDHGPSTRWDFGPADDQVSVHDAELADLWGSEARGVGLATTGRLGSISLGEGSSRLANVLGPAQRLAVSSAWRAHPDFGRPISPATPLMDAPATSNVRGLAGMALAHASGAQPPPLLAAFSAVDWLRRYLLAAGLSLPMPEARTRDLGAIRR